MDKSRLIEIRHKCVHYIVISLDCELNKKRVNKKVLTKSVSN